MHVINDTNLQMADIVFAFEDYYDNAQTVKSKLGNKRTTSDQDVMLGAFEGLLKKHTAWITVNNFQVIQSYPVRLWFSTICWNQVLLDNFFYTISYLESLQCDSEITLSQIF